MTDSTCKSTSPLLLGFCAAGLLGVVALGVWLLRTDPPPRLNADTVTLARFVATDEYLRLPFERQDPYMRIIEDRDDNNELDRAYATGQLSEADYRAAIQEAWLGQLIKRSERYIILNASGRANYIADLLDRKEAKKAKAKKKPARPPEGPFDPKLIKRDPSHSEMRIASWPAPIRQQVETFRTAYDAARADRQSAARQGPADEDSA